jgi:hypothetical protein
VSSYYEMNDNEKQEFRDWIRGVLKTEVATIKFTKKDGTERLMKATLFERLVAPVQHGSENNENDEYVRVTDVEIDQWRTIRFDSIKEINFELGSTDKQYRK